MIVTKKYSFVNAIKSLPANKRFEARQKIAKALGITSPSSMYNRERGDIEPKISEAIEIEKILRSYGVKKIWD